MNTQAPILVTGGTGFLGRWVVQELRRRGATVRTMSRRTVPPPGNVGGDHIVGSILDPIARTRALEGVRKIIHLATTVEIAPQHPGEVFAVQVEGTRALFREACDGGVSRIVHVSTSGTVGISESPSDVASEDSPYAEHLASRMPYYSAKIFTEKAVLELAHQSGAPIVVANPSLLLGPGAETPTPGDLMWRFLSRNLPVTPPGIVSVVDVRCVAGTVADMLDRGRAGQRYLLGAENLSFQDLFARMTKASGVAAPRVRPGRSVFRAVRLFLDENPSLRWAARDGFRADLERGYLNWSIDSQKARAELGFSPLPLAVTLGDTVDWIRRAGASRARTVSSGRHPWTPPPDHAGKGAVAA